MAIDPPPGPGSSAAPLNTGLSPHPRSNRGQVRTAEQRASDSEDDAKNRIARSEKQVEEANRNAAYYLDEIRDDYNQKSESESVREEDSIAKQKLKGYEELRDLKRAQLLEVARLRREGERVLSAANAYYRDTLYTDRQHGEQDLGSQRKQHATEMNYVQKVATDEVAGAEHEHELQVGNLREHQADTYKQITDASKKELDHLRETAADATVRSQKHFQDRFHSQVTTQDDVIANLENNASKKIREVRADTADKLSAYSSRQRDPFYKMKDLGAQLHDAGDRFVLTATVPEHEQQHLSVAVKGNELVVSGYRRNEEKLDLGPGRTKGTSSFQSFSESFPLTWPVNKQLLSRQFDGDTLIVVVPKANEHVFREPEKPKPERLRVERPKFPENLPHTKPDAVPDPDGPEPGPSKKSSGSGTILT